MVNHPTKKTEVFLSLGSNIDPEENLKYACGELKKPSAIFKFHRSIETNPLDLRATIS
tara:strand:- start:593 stop:766 length:174 start_codon:yes stop_codon:yes gene_type:complete